MEGYSWRVIEKPDKHFSDTIWKGSKEYAYRNIPNYFQILMGEMVEDAIFSTFHFEGIFHLSLAQTIKWKIRNQNEAYICNFNSHIWVVWWDSKFLISCMGWFSRPCGSLFFFFSLPDLWKLIRYKYVK